MTSPTDFPTHDSFPTSEGFVPQLMSEFGYLFSDVVSYSHIDLRKRILSTDLSALNVAPEQLVQMVAEVDTTLTATAKEDALLRFRLGILLLRSDDRKTLKQQVALSAQLAEECLFVAEYFRSNESLFVEALRKHGSWQTILSAIRTSSAGQFTHPLSYTQRIHERLRKIAEAYHSRDANEQELLRELRHTLIHIVPADTGLNDDTWFEWQNCFACGIEPAGQPHSVHSLRHEFAPSYIRVAVCSSCNNAGQWLESEPNAEQWQRIAVQYAEYAMHQQHALYTYGLTNTDPLFDNTWQPYQDEELLIEESNE